MFYYGFGIYMNRRFSKTINESPKKIIKCSIMNEDINSKVKHNAKSSFAYRYKGIFKSVNPQKIDFNKNESEEEKSDDTPEGNEKNSENNKNKKKGNEIRIMIKKKNK